MAVEKMALVVLIVEAESKVVLTIPIIAVDPNRVEVLI